jgi:dethiobiotin synthetase
MAKEAAEKSDTVLIEGAGGISVEISEGYSFADLARDLSIPVLLVVGNRLGALNHARLTITYLNIKGLPLFGVVLNDLDDSPSASRESNEEEIRRMAGEHYLGRIPYGAAVLPENIFSVFREHAFSR